MDPNPPSPFNPRLPGQPPPSGGKSRTRPLLIGCGAAFVLLGIAAVILMAKLPELADWVFERLEQQVMAKLPPDVTPEERQRLDVAFDAAAQAIGENKADPNKAQELNTVLMQLGQPSHQLTREDVIKLLTMLEEVAGKKPGD